MDSRIFLFALLLSIFLFQRISFAQDRSSQSSNQGFSTGELVASDLEKLVFVDGENSLVGLYSDKIIHYSFAGYIGGPDGFSDNFFDYFSLFTLAKPEKQILLSINLKESDVVSIFTDGATPRVGPLAQNLQANLLQLLGVVPDARYQWDEQALFDGACYLTHLKTGDHVEKTIAWINLKKVGLWNSTEIGAGFFSAPAACIVAGIASHLGLRNLSNLEPGDFVSVAETRSKRLVVSRRIREAIKNLYGSSLSEGMSRGEFRHRISSYWDKRVEDFKKTRN